MVLQVLLTLLIRGTADSFLTGCRHAAKCSPAYTVNIAGITAGRCSGFIGAGLLFENHQRSHRGRRKGTKRNWRHHARTRVLFTYSAQRISQDVGWIPLVRR